MRGPAMTLLDLEHWIFDLDGTLTHAIHDFESIRAELGIPSGTPILEALATMSRAESEPLYERLHAIELELACSAVPQPGVNAFLEMLRAEGRDLGIVTRNSTLSAVETLRRCGLERFFEPECIVGRESAAPKPSPEGINQLLRLWQADARRGVMVGDYLFDLQAGRAAGTWTLYVDPDEEFPFRQHADQCISGLNVLLDSTRKG